MADRYQQLEKLINSLTEIQSEHRVGDLIIASRSEPQSAESRLGQVEQVLEAYRSLGTGRGDAGDLELLLNLGRTYDQFAHLDRAQECYQSALTIADRLRDDQARAVILRRMGTVMHRKRRWEKSLELLERSQVVFGQLDDPVGQALVALNRGIVHSELGNLDEAESCFKDAIEFAQSGEAPDTVADAQSNLAILATIRGDFEHAIERYEDCLKQYETLNDEAGLARTYQNLGMAHADRDDWKGAMASYEQAFELAEKIGLLDIMANVYLCRAELLLELGDTSMASSCCALALDIYRELDDALGEADTYRLLGRVFAQRRQWAIAESLFEDSIRLNLEYENPLNVAETQRDIGRMHISRGQKLKAREILQTARDGFLTLGAEADVAEVEQLLQSLDSE